MVVVGTVKNLDHNYDIFGEFHFVFLKFEWNVFYDDKNTQNL